jgi:fatty acid desaturase
MPDHHRRNRALRLVIIAALLELVLYLVARAGPALASLMRIGMVIVATWFSFTIWHDARERTRNDRRQGERRQEQKDDSAV